MLLREIRKLIKVIEYAYESETTEQGDETIIKIGYSFPYMVGDLCIRKKGQLIVKISDDSLEVEDDHKGYTWNENIGFQVNGTMYFQDGIFNPFHAYPTTGACSDCVAGASFPQEFFEIRLDGNPAIVRGNQLEFLHPVVLENPVLELSGTLDQVVYEMIRRIRCTGSWDETDIKERIDVQSLTSESFKDRHRELLEKLCEVEEDEDSKDFLIELPKGRMEIRLGRIGGTSYTDGKMNWYGPPKRFVRENLEGVWVASWIGRAGTLIFPRVYWPEYREVFSLIEFIGLVHNQADLIKEGS